MSFSCYVQCMSNSILCTQLETSTAASKSELWCLNDEGYLSSIPCTPKVTGCFRGPIFCLYLLQGFREIYVKISTTLPRGLNFNLAFSPTLILSLRWLGRILACLWLCIEYIPVYLTSIKTCFHQIGPRWTPNAIMIDEAITMRTLSSIGPNSYLSTNDATAPEITPKLGLMGLHYSQ